LAKVSRLFALRNRNNKHMVASMTTTPYELPSPPEDSISSLKFSAAAPSKLIVSSWDKHVYLYDLEGPSLLNKFEFRAGILDACFGTDDKEAFVSGLDWDVRRYTLSKR
jgi:cell cycle arrest protein BUB3